jgi:hypothetical protein
MDAREFVEVEVGEGAVMDADGLSDLEEPDQHESVQYLVGRLHLPPRPHSA